ncbi:hypothetical protein Scep_009482 [Stephania cephalantha]|uniref:Uncharacterized protein n=1 Tax=Stephania cephalantha TaxID=152367 RepID=A0AAP0JTS2_9MAGN
MESGNSSQHSPLPSLSPVSFAINNQLMAPFGNSLNQIVSIKLGENIFSLWKSNIVPILEGCHLDGILFGTTPILSKLDDKGEFTREFQEWFS